MPPKPLNLTRPQPQRSISFKHLLLNSPLPSPSLPSILPRHGKKPPKLNSRKLVRLLCWIAALVFVYWCVFEPSHSAHDASGALLSRPEYLSANGKAYEIVGEAELPEYALPVAVTDQSGRSKWTVSIPAALEFPLSATDYADICSQADDVAGHIAELKGRSSSVEQGYYRRDPDYVDVAEAQATGLLPPDRSQSLSSEYAATEVCARSLTYVLDATNAGLGSTLLGLWLSYSLAQHENRAFFIDDTLFAYGSYSAFFTPPPTPSCRPPPSTQRVPCPRQARHLVVSAATTPWTFGEAFNAHFSRKVTFEMLRAGYEALFHLSIEDDATYVQDRIAELRRASDTIVGIHVRHGDRRPREFQYSGSYIPLTHYMQAATDLVDETSTLETSRPATLILASDDPDVYDSAEVAGTVRAQSAISLASKKSLGNRGVGWEGGFFRNVFWSLGLPVGVREKKAAGGPRPSKQKLTPQQLAAEMAAAAVERMAGTAERDYRARPTEEALVLRQLIARAYLLDLAVLGASDRVVCAASSAGCRILGVMMGWERVRERGEWRNVDGGVGREGEWRGLERW